MAALMGAGSNKPTVGGAGSYTLAGHHRRHADQADVPRTCAIPIDCGEPEEDLNIGFMSLPAEVRLSIYEYIHSANVTTFPDLAPGYPAPAVWEYHLRPVRVNSSEKETSSEDDGDGESRTARMLSPYRPYGRMPTALLLTSRAVYYEARVVPFQHGEFVFQDCWCSGLWSATAVTRGMEGWQLQEMRYVRLEVQWDTDLGRNSPLWRWVQQCRRWHIGLQGLRLRISSLRLPLDRRAALTPSEGQTLGHGYGHTSLELRPWLDDWTWVRQGLMLLGGLRRLEVDLNVLSATASAKLDWCRELRRVVREEGRTDIEVVCVEKIKGDAGERS